MSHVLAAVFFVLSAVFVWRSFYGMRIGSARAAEQAGSLRRAEPWPFARNRCLTSAECFVDTRFLALTIIRGLAPLVKQG